MDDLTSGVFYSSIHYHCPVPSIGDHIVIKCGQVRYEGVVDAVTSENVVIHTDWVEVE